MLSRRRTDPASVARTVAPEAVSAGGHAARLPRRADGRFRGTRVALSIGMRRLALFALLGMLALPLAATAAEEAGASAANPRPGVGGAPESAAQILARARAAIAALPYDPETSVLREIEARFISALDAAPTNRAVRAGLAAFYRDRGDALETPSPALLARIAGDSDPAGLVIALVGSANEGVAGALAQHLLLAALRRQPQQPVLWYELAERAPDAAARAAYLAEAAARAEALGERGAEAARALTAARLSDLVASGLLEEAVAASARLSDALRREVEEKPLPEAPFDVLGLRLAVPARDLRLDLAVAEAVAGDPRRAAALVAGLPWHLRLGGSSAPSNATVIAALIHCAIGDVAGDPFRFVSTALTWRSAGGDGPLDSAADWRLIATIARQRGALHLEAYALDTARAWWTPCDGCDVELADLESAFPVTAGHARTLRGELDRRALAAEDARTALLREIDARDRVAIGIAQRVATRSVFSVVTLPPLPADETTEEAGEEGETQSGETAPETSVLRVDPGDPGPGGRPTATVVDRADVDPAGAFWLELDRSTGVAEAVFTGLPARRYEVAAHSTLPLLDGDSVQIEARDYAVEASDDAEVVSDRVLLRATLASLRADSDGDGLTDVTEAAWLTDPQRADTDADGLDDAVDPSPLVPGGRVSLEAEPLALVLATIFGTTTEILLPGRAPSCCERVVLPTQIVVAPRALLAGVGGAARLLVLTPLEHEARPDEARLRAAAVLSLIYFDDAMEHGIVTWYWDASGGTLRLERRADGWHVERLTDWVS